MTKFDQKSFGIGAPKDNKYRDNWDSVFGKKEEPDASLAEVRRIAEQLRTCTVCAVQLDGSGCRIRGKHYCQTCGDASECP